MPDIAYIDIKYLPGVGPKKADLLNKELGIYSYRDMLYISRTNTSTAVKHTV